MRRAKKGLAILASTVLMVTSAINYHGLTFSTNVYSEETSNAETVSETSTESVPAEAPVKVEEASQTEAMLVNVEVPESEAVVPETVAIETVGLKAIAPENNSDPVTAESETIADENESGFNIESTSAPEQTELVSSAAIEENEVETAIESTGMEEISEELEDNSESEEMVETSEFETKEETETEEKSTEAETEDGFTAMSLLPLEEIHAYLHLEDKTLFEIGSMSIDEILNSLEDSEGNKITIRPENATTAWFKDQTGYVEQYIEFPLGQNIEFHLTGIMEFIVGSKNQLDRNNKRYLIEVISAKTLSQIAAEDEITYKLYYQDEFGMRTEVVPDNTETCYENLYQGGRYLAYVNATFVHDPNYWNGKEYYLGIYSDAARFGVDIDVYTYEEYLKIGTESNATTCTDQILNLDMTKKDSGKKGIYDSGSNDETNRIFVIRYKNSKGNQEYSFVEFNVAVDVSALEHSLCAYDGNEMVDVVWSKSEKKIKNDVRRINSATGKEETFDKIETVNFTLKKGYSKSEELYYSINTYGGNSGVVKAVEGLYKTLEQAANQPDIKEQLIAADSNQIPRGYKSTYNEPKYFTIFGKNNSVFNIELFVEGLNDDQSASSQAPIIGQMDPWFQIIGVEQNDHWVSSFIAQNRYFMNMYTMYGYGYQTVLIQDENVDLSKLQPKFLTDEDYVTKVTVNGQEVKSGQVMDCSSGSVQFTVVVRGHQKNYQVNFVKATQKSKVFVAGPQTQEVFLNSYTEYKHDILIANLGQEELTGLRVELNATNCKLDDYWTVGGENNNTLAPFDKTYEYDAFYGVLGNLAKVRLVPLNEDGGKIEGTLTVYADGQDPVVINLIGYAQDPKIVTDQEKFSKVKAVKYVPYSYMITTNNMYDWIYVSYELEGTLPNGVNWYPYTGEIYGVPEETGEFPIRITAKFNSDVSYGFGPSSVDLVLTVDENTPENVYHASSEGYSIKQALGTDMGDYNFVLTSLDDAVFVSNGNYSEFDNEYCNVWLNGKKLEKGTDYDSESGSTRITIHGETFENTEYVNQDGDNTIAIEFRKEGKRDEELNRTSQNFKIDLTKPTEPETTEPTTAEPTKPTVEPTKPTVEPTTAEPTKPTVESTTAEPTKPTVTSTTAEVKNSTAVSSTTAEATTAKSTTAEVTKEVETTGASVTCTVKMVDADNKTIDNLNLELHSTPQNALTDTNGCAAFDSIEFGSHTLSVKSIDGATEASMFFTITEGKKLDLTGNVITAPNGANFILTVRYDQGNLELVSAHDNTVKSSEVILGIEDYAEWIGAFLLGIGIAMFMCLLVYTANNVIKKRK